MIVIIYFDRAFLSKNYARRFNYFEGLIMGTGTNVGIDFLGAVTAIVEDIVEFGFLGEPFIRPETYSVYKPDFVTAPDQTRLVDARYFRWANYGADRSLALPVPILYPQARFHKELSPDNRTVWDCQHGREKPWYSGPEGNRNSVESDVRCPYYGKGARAGQLVYKYGENGVVQPVWNEYSFNTLGEEGELYFRINITNDDLDLGYSSGYIRVVIARNPVSTPRQDMIYTVYARRGWTSTRLPRWTNWRFIKDDYSPNAFMSLPMPAVVHRDAKWTYDNGKECGPGGCKESVEGDARYPYSGPGAKRGQLLFKYGAKGTVLPLWSGDAVYAQECTGSLYLACNGPTIKLPDDGVIRDDIYVGNAGIGLLPLRIS